MATSEVALDFSQAQPISASPVSLDFTKAQPIPAQSNSVSLDFAKARPINSSVTLDFTKAQPLAHDPNDRFFSGGQGEIRAYQPTTWDRIRSAVTAGIPNHSSRTVYNPKYGQMQLLSPEEAMTPSEQRAHPITTGIGEIAGGLTSPQSVALLAGTGGLGELLGAVAMLPRLMSAGFGAQAIYSAAKSYPEIRAAIQRGDVSETERLLTHAVLNLAMAAAAGQHAIKGTGAITGRTNEPASETSAPRTETRVADSSTAEGVKTHNEALARAKQELGPAAGVRDLLQRAQQILTEPSSPVGELLHEQAPNVRLVDSSAGAHDLLERDTVLRPVGKVVDPALAPLEAQMRGRAQELRQKYPVSPEADAQARVTGPSNIAAFRNPTARVVSDGHVPVISRDQILAQSISNVLSNSAELRKAGVDSSTIKTTGDIEAALQVASDHIRANLDPRASATLTFEMQRGLAVETGKTVEDLLSARPGEAMNAENLLAARMLLKQSYNHVLEMARTAADSGDDASRDAAMTALSQHKAIQERVSGVRAEAGRALGQFRIGQQDLPATKIANVFEKLPENLQGDAVKLLSKLDQTDPRSVRALNEFVEKITPRTTLEKLHEYYRNALLSSPHTIIVKTASELSMAAMEAMKKAVAAGIAKFKDNPDRFSSEAYYYSKGMAQALAEHAKPILSGEFQLEGSPGFERAGQQAIKGKIGSVVRAPSEAMSRMTNLLYAGNFFGELNALAARQALSEGLESDAFHARQEYLAHHPTAKMSESAHKLATTNTFQNELSGFAQKIGQAIAAKPNVAWLPESLKSVAPGRWLFPFYKTPVNLVKASLTHVTPYDLLNGIAKGDTDAMARGVLGSSIAASLAALALSGHITGGGPIDWKKAETKRATGWQPYSLKIDGKYFSYHRFEPVGLAAGLIADAVHGMTKGDSEVVAQSKADSAVKHIMRNLDDLAFMGTLANLLQAIHDPVGGRAQSFINREAGSLVPAGVANVAESLDRTVRRPQTALQAIESRIPGLTQAAPPIIDITGNRVQRPVSNFGGANPFPFTTAKHDPVVDEMSRLGLSTPQPPTQIKWRGKEAELTDAERQQLAQEEGAELYRRVSRLIQSGAWQKRSDNQKRKALVELHRMIDDSRPARLTRLRRRTQSDLARSSL